MGVSMMTCKAGIKLGGYKEGGGVPMRMGGQSREEKFSVLMPGAHLRTVLGHNRIMGKCTVI
jgi:hypothetical protein